MNHTDIQNQDIREMSDAPILLLQIIIIFLFTLLNLQQL